MPVAINHDTMPEGYYSGRRYDRPTYDPPWVQGCFCLKCCKKRLSFDVGQPVCEFHEVRKRAETQGVTFQDLWQNIRYKPTPHDCIDDEGKVSTDPDFLMGRLIQYALKERCHMLAFVPGDVTRVKNYEEERRKEAWRYKGPGDTQKPPTVLRGPFVDSKAPNPRLVGVEVEFNNRVNALSAWEHNWEGSSVHEDGSCGYEAVTPPMSGVPLELCVKELSDLLKKHRAGCNANCGLHVHVDASDLDWTDIIRLCTLWAKVEPAMFLIAGQQRSQGSYSSPVGASLMNLLACCGKAESPKAFRGLLSYFLVHSGGPVAATSSKSDILYHADIGSQCLVQQGRVTKKGGNRYQAMNLMPWLAGQYHAGAEARTKPGFKPKPDTTVEFRLGSGTHSASKILAWSNLCSDVVRYAATHSMGEILSGPRSAIRMLIEASPRSKSFIMRCVKQWRTITSRSADAGTGILSTGDYGGLERLLTFRDGLVQLKDHMLPEEAQEAFRAGKALAEAQPLAKTIKKVIAA